MNSRAQILQRYAVIGPVGPKCSPVEDSTQLISVCSNLTPGPLHGVAYHACVKHGDLCGVYRESFRNWRENVWELPALLPQKLLPVS
jgi:hypothetical protein